MMYLTYCLHNRTLNLTVLSQYTNKKDAISNLKLDAEQFMITYKGYHNLNTIFKKQELKSSPEGYYYKTSNKYPNRASIYERTNRLIEGTFYNSNDVKIQKILVFAILELSELTPRTTDLTTHTPKTFKDSIGGLDKATRLEFMNELKCFLSQRRIAIDGPSEQETEEPVHTFPKAKLE